MLSNLVRYTFGSKDKLKSRKEIDLVFKEGRRLQHFPLTVWYLFNNTKELKAGVGAAKRSLKLATQRNKAKRLIREVYRVHKPELEVALKDKNSGISIFFLYSSSEVISHTELEVCMKKVIGKLILKINETN